MGPLHIALSTSFCGALEVLLDLRRPLVVAGYGNGVRRSKRVAQSSGALYNRMARKRGAALALVGVGGA